MTSLILTFLRCSFHPEGLRLRFGRKHPGWAYGQRFRIEKSQWAIAIVRCDFSIRPWTPCHLQMSRIGGDLVVITGEGTYWSENWKYYDRQTLGGGLASFFFFKLCR